MKKNKVGHPPAGGPRISIRFNTEAQLEQLEKTVARINKKSKFGSTVTRNGFAIDAIMTAIQKAK